MTQDDTIFVSGMDPDVTENEINDHFGSIGIIKKDRRTQKPKIWIYRNKETGAGKGEATITYDDSSAASSAIDWFDGKDFNGNKIKVSLAQRNNSWQQKGGGGGGGGGKRGGFGGEFFIEVMFFKLTEFFQFQVETVEALEEMMIVHHETMMTADLEVVVVVAPAEEEDSHVKVINNHIRVYLIKKN